jgi:hypothetical protein
MLSCDADGAVAEVTEIRKRCAPPSSRRTRLRRLKRSGSPCKSSSRKRRMSESSWNGRRHHPRVAGVDTRPASARKLVSALWQLDGGVADASEGEVGWDAAAARRGTDHHRRSSSMEVSQPSCCLIIDCSCSANGGSCMLRASELVCLFIYFPLSLSSCPSCQEGRARRWRAPPVERGAGTTTAMLMATGSPMS